MNAKETGLRGSKARPSLQFKTRGERWLWYGLMIPVGTIVVLSYALWKWDSVWLSIGCWFGDACRRLGRSAL